MWWIAICFVLVTVLALYASLFMAGRMDDYEEDQYRREHADEKTLS